MHDMFAVTHVDKAQDSKPGNNGMSVEIDLFIQYYSPKEALSDEGQSSMEAFLFAGILDEGSCVDIALADMMTIIFRMNGADPNTSFDLTPQIGIDRDRGIGSSIQMCTKPELGLEKTSVYPNSKLPRNYNNKEDWEEAWYETACHERYRIERIRWIEKKCEIEKNLLRMYGRFGFGYPIVGSMYMGNFTNPAVARKHATKGRPYRHPRNAVPSGVKHALLIVGLNTMSDNKDDHYCLVKNSYGEEWGEKGYSRVGIEVFEAILYPIQPRTIRKRKMDD
ncbi:transducin/WD40 repeat-like superfamily protein [Tanacetum coccineum]